MKSVRNASLALLATTAIAHAGGVERSSQSVGVLFEEGTYAELSFSFVDPTVDGIWSNGSVDTGDMAASYVNYAARYRQDITDQISFGLILENHIGANTDYPTGTNYFGVQGSSATIDGDSLTAFLRYEMPSNFSIYGGARVSRVSGEASLAPGTPSAYTLNTNTDTAFGYVIGAAYEIPDIALRVSLTYNAEYTHEFNSTENGAATGTFETTVPRSLHLEAQTGIAEDTLLFGSVRWVEWSEFDITPFAYASNNSGESLINFEDDRTAYTLGVGRRFSESFSGAVSLTYEAEINKIGANLSPTDGRIGIGIGGTYTTPQGVEISGGVSYASVGNTITEHPAVGTSEFSGNSVFGAGITIGMNF